MKSTDVTASIDAIIWDSNQKLQSGHCTDRSVYFFIVMKLEKLKTQLIAEKAYKKYTKKTTEEEVEF